MIYQARYAIPMVGEIISDAEVLVCDGVIVAVGADLRKTYPCESVIDLGNTALLPGFVNAHSHIEPTFRRNFADGYNLWDWLGKLGFGKGIAHYFLKWGYELLIRHFARFKHHLSELHAVSSLCNNKIALLKLNIARVEIVYFPHLPKRNTHNKWHEIVLIL